MVTHIVFFKLKDRSAVAISQAKDKLLSMEGKIDVLRHLEVGVDIIRSERSYDLALLTKFDCLTTSRHIRFIPTMPTTLERESGV